jgi:hypothetical protein
MRGGERPGVAHRDRVRIEKVCVGADKLEFATGQLFAAMVRKLFDERVLSRHHFGEIKTNIFRADAPWPGMTGEVQDFGGVEQRLRGHAAAQDTQPAYFRAAFDHDRSQSCGGGRPRRRVTSTTAAQDGDIVVKSAARFVHVIFPRASMPGLPAPESITNSSPPIIERFYFSAVVLHRVEAQCDFLLRWVSKEFFPVIPPSSCVVSFAINLGFANVLYTGSSMASSVPRPSRSPLSSP